MKIYKYKYNYRGKLKESKVFTIEFVDHSGTKRPIKGDRNFDIAMHYARQIERFVRHKKLNERPDLDLVYWLQQDAPDYIRECLLEYGIIEERDAAAGRDLLDHVKDFEAYLKIERSEHHAKQTADRVRRIVNAAGFRTWQDINESTVKEIVSGFKIICNKTETKKTISQQNQKHYLRIMKQFCRWAEDKAKIIIRSPLAGMTVGKAVEKARERRVLSEADLTKLLEAVKGFQKRYFLTGYERYLVYRLAVETGLRAKEIRALKVCSFNLEKRIVFLDAGCTKNRKVCSLPIRLQTSLELKDHFRGRLPVVQAFQLPLHTARMIKEDLKQAGLSYKDDQDRVFDFHALRHQFGSMLAARGVHPKTAQILMRHSDINLTMALYTHSLVEQEFAAVESLPDLKATKAKTGVAG